MAFALYSDENAMRGILFQRLRGANVDCLTSNEAGNGRLPDEAQLQYATSVSRVIVTHDKGDFGALHGRWMAEGREHAGIIILTRGKIGVGVVFAKLMRLQAERSAEDMRNAILFIGPSPIEETT